MSASNPPPQVTVRVCVPITAAGEIDPRWGRADQVAIVDIVDGEVRAWAQHDVGWGTAHDTGTEGAHHARIASFLREHDVEAVAVDHVGTGMQRMLATMGIRVVTGLSGDPHTAARTAAAK
jgi:predicted Fe-Mo cluster-binding NifX family protein